MNQNMRFKLTAGSVITLLAWLGLVFLCMPPEAYAREAKPPDQVEEKAPQEETKMQGILVTAQKREENIQDVPISMSVLSGAEIEDAGIVDMSDLTNFTPNVYSYWDQLIIRGVSTHSMALNSPSGLFVDDINYPFTSMQNPDLMDIERVEVLRGPQGTLYGRNTESGAIRIITKQPGNEVRGTVYGEPGFYNGPDRNSFLFNAGANVSGPVVKDKLFMGVAFETRDSDGFIENIYNGDDKAAKIDHKTGQAKLRWTPSEKWDISFLANAFEKDDGYGHSRYIDGSAQTDRYIINWNGPSLQKVENNGQALRAKYSADSFDLVSISVRNDFEHNLEYDGELGPEPYQNQRFKTTNTYYSQEFRFSSADNDTPFKWLAGIYGFSEEVEVDASFLGQSRETDYDTKGYAVFGQATYTLFKRLHLTAGLRFDQQSSDGTQKSNLAPDPYSADLESSEVLPKGSISFDVTQDLTLYTSVAKGFLAGGYNYGMAQGRDNFAWDPEYTWNYEIGMKSSWLNNKLTLNAAFYRIDISDKQVSAWLAGPALRSITNAGKASSQGFELELALRPAVGWRIFGGIGYADATIDEWVSDEKTGGSYDYSGKRLTSVPEYTYNAGAEYIHTSGLFGRADLTGVSDFYKDAKNEYEVGGHQLVNLRLGYKSSLFDVVLWCKNLFENEYYLSKSSYFIGTIVEDGAPRSIGVRFTYRF
ncbi:TonB-dependent receptor [Dethiosulfatarculus sandiegensis]|uniref:TonB-denpendent receptor n=1 Tax=Dethiosulfatarculus sandiegensis TaxID=1429043 RepID=A0A0D2JQ59_9BACT|nr:TonB-dependent receptor [Dethiosulfatarculus sandiegensis]KIX11620.1 hypothetical protein X474_23405 [Dethiosulfatarculus sandiegensis]